MSPQFTRAALLLFLLVPLTGCESAYYGAWEKLGWAKRDILVDRVEETRDSQNAAKEQFQTTLERFQSITNFAGGELEAKYKELNSAYERSRSRAEEVTERIDAVEDVADDMFAEWKEELEQYSDASLRSSSQQKLRDTQARYEDLLGLMRRSEQRMQPVLAAFKDQVLYLKHNLNAQAISSLQETAANIESDVAELISAMNASIAEANEFIKQMK
jgi:hypothetical protein